MDTQSINTHSSPAQDPTVLEIKDLHVYIGKAHLLKGVSLTIERGEMLGLIGPNGSGKTTLFNSISGFLTPRKGSLQFHGKDILGCAPHERAQLGIGRVFQNFGIFRELTVQENILLALESRQGAMAGFFPWTRKSRRLCREAKEHLSEVGLVDKADEKASSLSGGQMRLLEIIRALAFGADIFLLDEPTAGVSPKMKHDVASLILRLKALGKSVFLIEHDMNFIQEFCERIVVMDGGNIILDDAPAQVRSDERLQEIYFGKLNSSTTSC